MRLNFSSLSSTSKLSDNFLKITIPIHLLLVASLWLMLSRLTIIHVLFWIIIWTCVSGLGLAIGYHRLLSHRAFRCHTWKKRLLTLLGAMAGQGPPIFWVAVHRGLHHPFADHNKDPHSPVHGKLHSFIGWQMYFSEKDFSIRNAIDLMRDPFTKALSLHYYKFYWTPIVLVAFIDIEFCLLSLVPALVLSIHQENLVNWLSHEKGFGYRNYEIDDSSNNHKLLALITWGQALHNNHHKYPRLYNFALKPGEYDPSATLIRLLGIDERKKKLTELKNTL